LATVSDKWIDKRAVASAAVAVQVRLLEVVLTSSRRTPALIVLNGEAIVAANGITIRDAPIPSTVPIISPFDFIYLYYTTSAKKIGKLYIFKKIPSDFGYFWNQVL
jgi:hypothetical protein